MLNPISQITKAVPPNFGATNYGHGGVVKLLSHKTGRVSILIALISMTDHYRVGYFCGT